MVFTKSTLSQQIFFSMIGLMSLALVIVAVININKIQKDTETYNAERLSRKDRAVAKSIEAIINLSTQYNVDLETAFRPILKDVGFIHKLKINIYNLDGQFIWSSDTTLLKDTMITQNLPKDKINQCFVSENKKTEYEKGSYFGTYRILYKDTATNQLTSSKPIINDSPFCILDVIYDKSTKEDVLEKTNQQIKTSFKINAGTYYIKVFNEDNTGHYSLAVGEAEFFGSNLWEQILTWTPIILYIGPFMDIVHWQKFDIRAYIPHIALLVLITIIYFLIKRIFFRRRV